MVLSFPIGFHDDFALATLARRSGSGRTPLSMLAPAEHLSAGTFRRNLRIRLSQRRDINQPDASVQYSVNGAGDSSPQRVALRVAVNGSMMAGDMCGLPSADWRYKANRDNGLSAGAPRVAQISPVAGLMTIAPQV